MKVAIIDYGAGNVKSVQLALERLEVSPVITADPQVILDADRVIFPGVGQAKYAMQQLQEQGLDELIPTLKQPVLGICLGMQLLCESSEEGGTTGLGIFKNVNVVKFLPSVKVPCIGWNELSTTSSKLFEGIPDRSFVYFVHSYYVPLNSCSIGSTVYGETEYASALEQNNFYGVQFHPEKSGPIGSEILRNFLNI